MNRLIYFLPLIVILGCAYEGRTLSEYIENPRTIIEDPHYAEHQEELDDLESQYLRKEISYAEYVEKRDDLESEYTGEVKSRTDIIEAGQ